MAVNNDDATKQIFSRCLLTCLQVPLWYVCVAFLFLILLLDFPPLIVALAAVQVSFPSPWI